MRAALGGRVAVGKLGFRNSATVRTESDLGAWDQLVAAGLAVRCPVCRAAAGLGTFHVLAAGAAALDLPADVLARAWPFVCPNGCVDRNG